MTVAVEIDETIGTNSKIEKTMELVNFVSSKWVIAMQSSSRESTLRAATGSKPSLNDAPCARASHAPAIVPMAVAATVDKRMFSNGTGGGGGAGGGGSGDGMCGGCGGTAGGVKGGRRGGGGDGLGGGGGG